MGKYMRITDLTDWYEGMDIETFETLEDAKESYDKEMKSHYSSALIEYTVIENFEREVDKI